MTKSVITNWHNRALSAPLSQKMVSPSRYSRMWDAAVERYYKDASDVIFRLLRLTHDDVPDVPLSLCGELAGRPEHIPSLLQCGIRTFSIAAPLIPTIKETIRNSWCSALLKRNH